MSNQVSAPLRIGMIGAGFFSRFHLEGWQAIADADIVAVCDQNLALARTAADHYGIPAVFDDAHEMLASTNLDLVDIVTPPSAHHELVMLSQAHAIPAICQKPLAGGLRGAEALLGELVVGGPPVIVHENFRFSPWYREMRTWIDRGRLGRIHGVSFRLRPGDGQGREAYLQRQPYFQTMPLLLVHETATHFVDTFRYLCGEVRAVFARLRRLNPAIAGEDAGVIHFEFDDQRIGLFDGNRLNEHPAKDLRRTMGECWLEGEDGVLRLDGDANLSFKPHGQDEQLIDYDKGPATFAGGACQRLQSHVVAHLRDGSPLENRACDYVTNLRVVEAIYASSATGRLIRLTDEAQ